MVARAFICVDIELTNSCIGPTLMSLRSVEVFVTPSKVNMIFCKWIEGTIAHISSIGSPDCCMVLDMSLWGHTMPPSWLWSPLLQGSKHSRKMWIGLTGPNTGSVVSSVSGSRCLKYMERTLPSRSMQHHTEKKINQIQSIIHTFLPLYVFQGQKVLRREEGREC